MHGENRAPTIATPRVIMAARMRVCAGWRCGLFEREHSVIKLSLSSSPKSALRGRYSLVLEVYIFKTDTKND